MAVAVNKMKNEDSKEATNNYYFIKYPAIEFILVASREK
jgi:hypothetical protein